MQWLGKTWAQAEKTHCSADHVHSTFEIPAKHVTLLRKVSISFLLQTTELQPYQR